MDGFRYVVAVLMAVSVPPAILFWLVIHPLAGFWRRLGKWPTLALLGTGWAAFVWACWLLRAQLLGPDLGTDWWRIVQGLALYLVAARLSRAVARHLKFLTLAGLPEFTTEHAPGRLLREGVYARIRHPRYVAFMLGITGAALIVNYRNLYVMTALMIPALFLVAVLEERELRERFGQEYATYAAAVPGFIPRFGRRA